MQILMSGAIPGEGTPYGHFGVRAVLAVLDTGSGKVSHLFEYEPPEELDGGQNVQFTGFSFDGGRLYVCSFNEILVLGNWPDLRLEDRITIPGFNDLHHCMPWEGGLAVANTGLETVDHVDFDGTLKQRWDLLTDVEGARRIEEEVDYRLIPNTKPHHRHVNHVFVSRGELWATQLRISAAVQVTGGTGRIELGVGMPHDGILMDPDRVFTTTNGHLVLADPDTGEIRERVNLVELTPDLEQLGWCRGVARHPDDRDQFFVAFTKGRRSRWKDVAYRLRHGHYNPPSRVALYDLRRGSLNATWMVGEDPGLILFQLEVLDDRHAI